MSFKVTNFLVLSLGVGLACGRSSGTDPLPARSPPATTASGSAGAPMGPGTAAASPSAAQQDIAPPSASPRPFPPPDITPPSARSADAEDGRWKPLDSSSGKPLLYSTLIHPHETSRFITVTLVAIDLARARLEFLPGVDDVGKQQVPFAPGLVPPGDRSGLVAVFNGGFMPQHGRWGMRVGETTLLPPRDPGCTIAVFVDGSVKIRSWPALASAATEIRVLRQTPPCLVEQGAVHADLLAGRDRAWAGHTPGIVTRRRSAIGLSEDAQTLFYAIGVEASPKLLATGLRAAGAQAAAQLDINWNWTRFLLFGAGPDGKLSVTRALVEVEHSKRDYVEAASRRDFFYIVRRD